MQEGTTLRKDMRTFQPTVAAPIILGTNRYTGFAEALMKVCRLPMDRICPHT